MEEIERIVDKAIEYTEYILARAPRHQLVAREGLKTMCDNLKVGAEDHEALRKLENYMIELSHRFAT